MQKVRLVYISELLQYEDSQSHEVLDKLNCFKMKSKGKRFQTPGIYRFSVGDRDITKRTQKKDAKGKSIPRNSASFTKLSKCASQIKKDDVYEFPVSQSSPVREIGSRNPKSKKGNRDVSNDSLPANSMSTSEKSHEEKVRNSFLLLNVIPISVYMYT